MQSIPVSTSTGKDIPPSEIQKGTIDLCKNDECLIQSGQICLGELYLKGQWMAHARNSLCNIIFYTTSNPIILLYSLLPNPTSILHLTPLHSSQSFHFLMSHLPTPLCPHSTIPIHLLSVPPIHLLPYPPSFHPSPTCPSPIS